MLRRAESLDADASGGHPSGTDGGGAAHAQSVSAAIEEAIGGHDMAIDRGYPSREGGFGKSTSVPATWLK